MNDQKIEILTEAELNWVNENIEFAKKLIQNSMNDATLTLTNLEQTYSDWYKRWQQEKDDPNPYINAFGLTFGKLLADNLNLEWKVVTDQYGTEIALHGNPGNILLFPTNLVAKRFEKEEINFFTNLFENFKRDIDQIRE